MDWWGPTFLGAKRLALAWYVWVCVCFDFFGPSWGWKALSKLQSAVRTPENKKTTRNYQKKVCTTLQVILSPYEVLLNVYPPGPVVPKNLQKSRYQDLGPIAALPVLELLRELLDVVELFLHIQSSGCTFDGHTSRPGRDGEQNAEPWKENLTIAWSVQFN